MSNSNAKTPWEDMKRFTSARIGLSRSGGSLSTKEMLQLRFDHAGARDAVWNACDWKEIEEKLSSWLPVISLHSAANSRQDYLLRPDLGRKLEETSLQTLRKFPNLQKEYDLSISIVDGLSPLAVEKNVVPFLEYLRPQLTELFPKIAPLAFVTNGRVAIGDQISESLSANMTVVLIGERPGLTTADSLGVYITYQSKSGTTDERRNCISNVRLGGLSYERAGAKLIYLLKEALSQKISGVLLKDRMVEGIAGEEQNKLR
ncbi:ethanolamine ammonia-lyase subunit EutC [Leptospira idonii]|uniref:Ethanolamine ammonia-lyase small subunit n=1 Tax=Leptospira idonii TaxID=1193500 RepID=A0A4R9LU18_9LEPT|nr:ethanolamine ammonia-lyase subunit EutC [Leptospira idonii]TGN17285.1 ethanolamine ammonia-lyase subunit EutC [Leptospira idonii]